MTAERLVREQEQKLGKIVDKPGLERRQSKGPVLEHLGILAPTNVVVQGIL